MVEVADGDKICCQGGGRDVDQLDALVRDLFALLPKECYCVVNDADVNGMRIRAMMGALGRLRAEVAATLSFLDDHALQIANPPTLAKLQAAPFKPF